MLLGVLHAQVVEVLVDGADARVELRVEHRDRPHAEAGHRLVAADLGLDRAPRLFSLGQFEPGRTQRIGRQRQLGAVVDALARQQRTVAHLEFLDRVLGRDQPLFDVLDLFVDELDRLLRIALLALEAALDEDGQQRLHHVAHQFRVIVVVGDGVDVVGAGAADLQLGHQQRDLLLDVRARQQGAAHDGHLLLDVGHAGHAAQERLEDALGVDEHPRARLVVVGHGGDPGPAGDADQPHDSDGQPAIFPDASHSGQQLGDELLHVLSVSVSRGEGSVTARFATY